jgi:hypothetical protein
MDKTLLIKLLDTIEDMGYLLESLHSNGRERFVMEIKRPLNEKGEPIDLKTGEPLQSQHIS